MPMVMSAKAMAWASGLFAALCKQSTRLGVVQRGYRGEELP